MLHGIVLKVVRDPAQSEEVTQEAFVELWRLAPRYDASRGSVRSWAATLAHRRAIDGSAPSKPVETAPSVKHRSDQSNRATLPNKWWPTSTGPECARRSSG